MNRAIASWNWSMLSTKIVFSAMSLWSVGVSGGPTMAMYGGQSSSIRSPSGVPSCKWTVRYVAVKRHTHTGWGPVHGQFYGPLQINLGHLLPLNYHISIRGDWSKLLMAGCHSCHQPVWMSFTGPHPIIKIHETPEGRAPLSLYTGSPAPVATKK